MSDMVTRYFVVEMVTYNYAGAKAVPALPYESIDLFDTEAEALEQIARLEQELAASLAGTGERLAYSVTRHVASVQVPTF